MEPDLPHATQRSDDVCERLASLIEKEQEGLLAAWRAEVRELPSARDLDVPTLNDHVPMLLREMAVALRTRTDETIAEAVVESLTEGSSPIHGEQRFRDGYDIEEVVAEYNILRASIHNLAERHGLSMTGRLFHVVNRLLDGAIGAAVQSFARQQAIKIQQRRDEYLAFVAHDLRTPLSAIALSTRLLEMQIAKDCVGTPPLTRTIKSLTRNVRQVQALVNKVLEESRNIQSPVGITLERRHFDLWPFVESLIQDLHPVTDPAVRPAGATPPPRVINAVPEDVVVFADADALRRIFQNLLANAFDYTPSGEIVVGAESKPATSLVECWVSDTGKGIPAERLQAIFEKYETDPEKEDGLGLGLAIVKTFVEAHEGEVTVTSEAGVGSTFRFTLPNRRE